MNLIRLSIFWYKRRASASRFYGSMPMLRIYAISATPFICDEQRAPVKWSNIKSNQFYFYRHHANQRQLEFIDSDNIFFSLFRFRISDFWFVCKQHNSVDGSIDFYRAILMQTKIIRSIYGGENE